MALTMTSQKPMHTTGRVDIDGAVDADGHILEPPTLWEDYIDPAFRDRALRIAVDENGLEELRFGDERSVDVTARVSGDARRDGGAGPP